MIAIFSNNSTLAKCLTTEKACRIEVVAKTVLGKDENGYRQYSNKLERLFWFPKSAVKPIGGGAWEIKEWFWDKETDFKKWCLEMTESNRVAFYN
jgi:hypothetical protein